jgi:hypothetical protein
MQQEGTWLGRVGAREEMFEEVCLGFEMVKAGRREYWVCVLDHDDD